MSHSHRIYVGLGAAAAIAAGWLALQCRTQGPRVGGAPAAGEPEQGAGQAKPLGASAKGAAQSAFARQSHTDPALPPGALPPEPKAARRRAAMAVFALYEQWDDQAFARLFPEGARHDLHEYLDYYRAQLGDCEPPVLWREGESRNRFASKCEHGIWEIAPLVDTGGDLVGLRHGAQGVDPGTAVLEAADAAMQLWTQWDSALFQATFVDKWEPGRLQELFARTTQKWGACELDDLDIGNARGALFRIKCEAGPQTMKIDLAEDDRIRSFALWGPRTDRPSFD